MMRRYQQRHAANGRASASLSITDTGRAEVRVSIGLGAGRFMTVGLSLAQVEAVADAISQVHDDIVEHYGADNDRPPSRAA